VSDANAALTPRARLKVARLVVDDGWPIARVAERCDVSWPTVKRWATRYAAMGQAGMADRSSRPHHQPGRTPPARVKRIVHLRWKQRLSPLEIAARLDMPASTVHAVLVRCRLNRLSHIDARTGEVVRRYEHEVPGALIHVDVKKLGNIPDGGGWRCVGRAQGDRHCAATPGKTRNRHYNPKMGTAFVHTVVDDHSRVAYAEIHDDETAATAVTVLRRAHAWFADRGVTIQRVLSDNGSCYRSHAWRDACAELAMMNRPGWRRGS
jgi:transposase InsO family protein